MPTAKGSRLIIFIILVAIFSTAFHTSIKTENSSIGQANISETSSNIPKSDVSIIDVSLTTILDNISITKCPTLYDIDKDGLYEVLIPSNDTLRVYKYNETSGRLEKMWEHWFNVTYELTIHPEKKNKTVSYVVSTNPVCADFNGDGEIEIAIGCGDHLFFLDKDGNTIREFDLDYNILNITVLDFDLDGLLEAVMRVQSPTNSIAHTDIFAYDGKVDYVSVTREPIGTFKAIDFPPSGKVKSIYRLVYITNNMIITRYQNGTTAPTFTYSLNLKPDNILLDIVPGNFSGINSSVEFVVILGYSDNISFVDFPSRKMVLNISLSELFNLSRDNISADKIVMSPLVSDFDNDSLDEVFIWARTNESWSLVSFVGIKNVTSGEYEYAIANLTVLNVTPIWGIVVETDNGSLPLILLSNGTILGFALNDTNISAFRFDEPVENATLLLVGDIDNDSISELLAFTNHSVILINFTAYSNWLTLYHDVRNTNYVNEPPDWDMDGYPDNIDESWNDSDIDDDWANDYTEYILGTNASNNDTDNDRLGDGWERRYNYDPLSNDTNNDNTMDWREDPDGDNITNYWEWRNRTNPRSNDTDGDGLLDIWEIEGNFTNITIDNTTVNITVKTDPKDVDTDDDLIPDYWETLHNLNATNSSDALMDFDDDGLTNLGEYVFDTDPFDVDSDDDELYDGYEVYYELDPLNPHDPKEDKDEDGISNYIEFVIGTDPTLNDTDGDGIPDGWEWIYDLNPLDTSDNETDIDGDGLTNVEEYNEGTNPRIWDTDRDSMPDGWEVDYGFDPTDPDDGYQDADLDSLINKDEFAHNTDPLDADSDDDGLSDGVEVAIGTDPLDADSDDDGLSDYEEVISGKNPIKNERKTIPLMPILVVLSLVIIASAFILGRFKS